MAKCAKCGLKKGKRHCPIGGRLICPSCCAALRAEDRRCRADCRHLAETSTFEEGKAAVAVRRRAVQVYIERQAEARGLFQRVEEAVAAVVSRDLHYEDWHYLEALSRVWQALVKGRVDSGSSDLGRPGNLERHIRETVISHLLANQEVSREDAGLFLHCFWSGLCERARQDSPSILLSQLRQPPADPEPRLIMTPAELRRNRQAGGGGLSGVGR